MIVLFFAGWPVPKVAVIAGALLLITRRVKPERVYREIDWGLLVMFIGLFIVIAGIEKTPLAGGPVRVRQPLSPGADRADEHLRRAALESRQQRAGGAGLQELRAARLPDPARAWLTLAMSSTLAGNLTVLGSVANLIVVERARREVPIGFREYAKAGVPLTLADLGCGYLDVKLADCFENSRAGEWFLRSGIQESNGGVARYYRTDLAAERAGVDGDHRLRAERAGVTRPPRPAPCGRAVSMPRVGPGAQAMPFELGDPASPISSITASSSAACSPRGAPPTNREYLDTAIAIGRHMLRRFDAGADFHPILALPASGRVERDRCAGRGPRAVTS